MSRKKKDKPVSSEPEYFGDQFDLVDEKDLLEEEDSKKRLDRQYFDRKRQQLAGMDYQKKITAHKRKIVRRIILAAAGVALLAGIILTVSYFTVYSSYKVVDTEKRTSGSGARYAEFYGKILRYSKDGATFYEKENKNVWNESYEMKEPIMDICGRYMVIAEENGTHVCVFDLNGKKSSFQVAMPIKKVQISEKGTLVLLMEQNDEHSLQYLDTQGTVIAEGKLAFEKSGYPLDISLSDDGFKLAVSYLQIKNGVPGTNMAFYSFASIGAAEIDNIVSNREYTGTVFPTVNYADDKRAVAFGDDRLAFFSGSQRPEMIKEIQVSEEIKSVFYNEKYAGIIVDSKDGMRMDVYDMDGKQILSRKIDFAYDRVKIAKDRIILYNDSQWCIYAMNGRQKLSPCKLSQPVSDIVALSSGRFILVMANKTEIVKLKR